MNLHGIVANTIAAVNPLRVVSVQVSTGNTTGADGRRTPTYDPPVAVKAQIQDLSSQDIRQLEALNIQASQQVMYLSGDVEIIQRVHRTGGDLITTDDGDVWLTTVVMEKWPDWCKVSVVLQNGS